MNSAQPPPSVTPPKLSFTDPNTFGEDLQLNIKRAIAIAPDHCEGCADYHIVNAVKRLSDNSVWKRGGRTSLLETLRPLIADIKSKDSGRADIVIAASADTAVLSTCVHATWLAEENLLHRVKFTVLDRCPTPLALCSDYGHQHGLNVTTDVVDLLDASKIFPADLIVLHNVLNFMPEDQHAPLLVTLRKWLKPDGRILLWNSVLPVGDRDRDRLRLIKRVSDIKAMIDAGRIEINEPKKVMFSRLERHVDEPRPGQRRFADPDAVQKLIASVGLNMLSLEETSHIRSTADGSQIARLYVTAVAGLPPT